MKRLAWLAVGSALFGWGIAGAIGGCGSSDAPVDDADGGSSGTSGSSGSSGTSGGTSGSSGDPGEGGITDGGTGEGGGDGGGDGGGAGQSNPLKISCGATACDAGDNTFCCDRAGDAGDTCETQNNQCQGINVARLECDEPADCNGGDQCCLGLGGGGLRSQCDNNCNGLETRLCKTNAQCGDGGACREVTCPGARKFRACSVPTGCM